MTALDRSAPNRRLLLFLILLAAVLFLGSVLFILSRAQG
jgi:hypothetical protein